MSKKFGIKQLHDKGDHEYCKGGCFSKGGVINSNPDREQTIKDMPEHIWAPITKDQKFNGEKDRAMTDDEKQALLEKLEEKGLEPSDFPGPSIVPGVGLLDQILSQSKVAQHDKDQNYLENSVGGPLSKDPLMDKFPALDENFNDPEDTQAFADGGEVAGENGVINNSHPEIKKPESGTAGVDGLLQKIEESKLGMLPLEDMDDEALLKHFALGGEIGSTSASVPEVQIDENDDSKKKGPVMGYADGGDPSFDQLANEGDDPSSDAAELLSGVNPFAKKSSSETPVTADETAWSALSDDTKSEGMGPEEETHPYMAGTNLEKDVPQNKALNGNPGSFGSGVPKGPVSNYIPQASDNASGSTNKDLWKPSPVAKPAAVTPSGASGVKTQTSPTNAGMNEDDSLMNYFKEQSGLLDKYGPDKQAAANKAINKAQYSPLGAIDQAVGGFADALMQGVARAGKGDVLSNIQAGWNGLRQNIVGEMKDMNEQEKGAVQAHIAMLDKDPTTGYAKGIQAAASKLIGGKGNEFAGVPPGMLTDIMKNATDSQDARARLMELINNNAQMRAIQQTNTRVNASQDITKNKPTGLWNRITSGDTTSTGKQVQNALGVEQSVANGGSGKPVATPEDKAAYQHAMANPNDPRSQKILSILKQKGLV